MIRLATWYIDLHVGSKATYISPDHPVSIPKFSVCLQIIRDVDLSRCLDLSEDMLPIRSGNGTVIQLVIKTQNITNPMQGKYPAGKSQVL